MRKTYKMKNIINYHPKFLELKKKKWRCNSFEPWSISSSEISQLPGHGFDVDVSDSGGIVDPVINEVFANGFRSFKKNGNAEVY